MSYKAEQLLVLSTNFEKLAANSLEKEADKKDKKKLDPKAEVRNRGNVCVPASSAKDKKDHFPINDEGQARNALARVHQYSSAPSWYSGSLKGLQDLVSRKVHSKYPSIGKDSKKKSSEYYDNLLTKHAVPAIFGPRGGPPGDSNPPAPAAPAAPAQSPLMNEEGKIDWSHPDAQVPAPGTGGNVIELDNVPPTAPAKPTVPRSTIPFRADVRAAQIQFNKWNKQNGNYGTPIDEDGKLGPKTRTAFSGYRPGGDVESIIKDLSEQGMTWNVRNPEPPPLPAPLPAPGKLELDKSDPWAKPTVPPSAAPTSTTASFMDEFFKKLS